MKTNVFGLVLGMALLSSCEQPPAYQAYRDLPGGQWDVSQEQSFSFEISESAVAYDIFYNVRSDIDYPFYNLYVKYELTDEQGEIVRSNLKDANLMDAESGRPLGVGIGDLYEHEVLLLADFSFGKPGKYTLTLRHNMRPDTLSGLQSLGATLRYHQEQ